MVERRLLGGGCTESRGRDDGGTAVPAGHERLLGDQSEKDAELAQKLGQLQPFMAAFPQECMGQLASFGPT